MKLGAVFPQTDVGDDPEAAVEFARRVEERGYDVLLAYDHVVGADPGDPAFDGPYDNDDSFHEPFTLFAHLAGVTETLTLGTGVLVLPQRQTALVAKQAAEVDVLSDGRLRVGVGVGWNEREYEALGVDFETRGRRIEEQVDLLRALWTDHVVEYDGDWHRLPGVGINPRPVQRPIPLWMGGEAPPVLRRIGRVADGWITPARFKSLDGSLEGVDEAVGTIRDHAREAGRDPDDVRIVARLRPDGPLPAFVERAREWRRLGATHVAVDTVGMELSVYDHIRKLSVLQDRLLDAGFDLD